MFARAVLLRWLAAIGWAVAAVGPLGCDDTEKRFVAASNQAVEALEHEDYTRAEQFLNSAIQLRPTDAETLYYLGALHNKRNRPTEAADVLQRAVAADPQFADAWLNLAKARYELRDAKGTQEALAALLRLDPGQPNGHMLAARLALGGAPTGKGPSAGAQGAGSGRDRVTADKELRAAIAGDPGFAPAYVLLAQVYSEVEAYEAARDVLAEGQRFAPQSVEVQEALGLTWLDLGRPDRAKTVLAAAAAHPKARPGLHLNYASALLQLGEKDAAMQALRTFILQSQGTVHQNDEAVQTAVRMLRHLKGG